MSILSDQEIGQLCDPQSDNPMVTPYSNKLIRENGQNEKIISYGQSSYGYDIRVDRQYKIFTNISSAVIDPKNFQESIFVEHEGDYCIIPPHSFVLCRSMETFNMPKNVTAICIGKSTYARTGLIVNVTPIESQWAGILTIELSNTTPLPLKIYSEEGIAQLLFFKGADCLTTYKERKGKYQNQTGITLPRL